MHMERLFKVIFDNQGQMYSGTRIWFPKCGHINVLIQFSTESIRVKRYWLQNSNVDNNALGSLSTLLLETWKTLSTKTNEYWEVENYICDINFHIYRTMWLFLLCLNKLISNHKKTFSHFSSCIFTGWESSPQKSSDTSLIIPWINLSKGNMLQYKTMGQSI